jgi:hypothetical protein
LANAVAARSHSLEGKAGDPEIRDPLEPSPPIPLCAYTTQSSCTVAAGIGKCVDGQIRETR